MEVRKGGGLLRGALGPLRGGREGGMRDGGREGGKEGGREWDTASHRRVCRTAVPVCVYPVKDLLRM